MAVTHYQTVNNRLIAAIDSNSRAGFLHDGLGSVTSCITGGSLTWEVRYKPFGAWEDSSGPTSAGSYFWLGSVGGRQSMPAGLLTYFRRRHYLADVGMWTSVDPLWPFEGAYTYAYQNPVSYIDPSGLVPQEIFPTVKCDSKCCCCPEAIDNVKVQRIRLVEGKYAIGHTLTYKIDVKYHKVNKELGEKPGHCSLQWWECSNNPSFGHPKPTPNVWQNLSYLNSPTFDPWKKMKPRCPGSTSVLLIDEPAMYVYQDGARRFRWLIIKPVVKKASGCTCDKAQVQDMGLQIIDFVNPPPGGSIDELKITSWIWFPFDFDCPLKEKGS